MYNIDLHIVPQLENSLFYNSDVLYKIIECIKPDMYLFYDILLL